MRVLLVSTIFSLSRDYIARSFVRDEAYELAKKGVEVHVCRWLHIRQNIPAGTRMIEEIFVHDAKFSLANVLSSLSSLFELPRSYFSRPKEIGILLSYSKDIEKLAKKYDVKLLHAHYAYPDGFVGLLARKRIGKPLVVTLHGLDILIEPTVNYGSRLNPEINRAVRLVLKHADKVIAASSATYKAAVELGCSPAKLSLIPNAVDIRQFDLNADEFYVRDKLGLRDNSIVFTLRAHETSKGIEYLIRAIPMVLKELPNTVFIIGGEGSLRSYHESLAKELEVSKNVIFTGRIPQEELPYFYAACDVFVIPSIVEAFGLVTAEAMACGKPVIGTNVGGIPDTIEDGINGFLVKPRDPEALAQKIILLLKDSKLKRKLGKAGRVIAEKRFNMEKRAEEIINLYNSL